MHLSSHVYAARFSCLHFQRCCAAGLGQPQCGLPPLHWAFRQVPRPRVRSAACCRRQGSSVPESHSLWQGTGGTRPKRRLAGCQSASSDWQCDTGIQRASDFLCKGSGRDFPEAAPAPCTVMPPVATQRAPDSKCMYIVILRLAVAHGAQDIPNGTQG